MIGLDISYSARALLLFISDKQMNNLYVIVYWEFHCRTHKMFNKYYLLLNTIKIRSYCGKV